MKDSFKLLCLKDIFKNGITDEAVGDYLGLGLALGLTPDTLTAFSEMVSLSGVMERALTRDELAAHEPAAPIECARIQEKYCLGAKCMACPDCANYANEKIEREKKALFAMLSQPPSKMKAAFPVERELNQQIIARFCSYENIRDERPGDYEEYVHLNAMFYTVFLRIVLAKEIDSKTPLYRSIDDDKFLFLFELEYNTLFMDDSIKTRLLQRLHGLKKQTEEIFLPELDKITNERKKTAEIKNIIGEFVAPKKTPEKKEEEKKQPVKEEAAPAPGVEKAEKISSIIENEHNEANEAKPSYELEIKIDDNWLTEKGFIKAGISDGFRIMKAYMLTTSACSVIEAVYNVSHSEYAFLLLFPDVKASELYDEAEGFAKIYISENSPLVGKTLKEHIEKNSRDHKICGNIVFTAAVCFRNGITMKNVYEAVTKSSRLDEVTADSISRGTFLSYLDDWKNVKQNVMPLGEFMYERALARSFYMSDVADSTLPFITYGSRSYVFGKRKVKMLREDMIALKAIVHSDIGRDNWTKAVKETVSAFEANGIMSRHGIRILNIDPEKQAFISLVPGTQYRAFYTVLARKFLKELKKASLTDAEIRIEAYRISVEEKTS